MREPGGGTLRARAFALLLAIVALVLAVPMVRAYGTGLTHFGIIGDGGGDGGGIVTVTSCSRGLLAVDWSCHGDYAVNDPMAQPYPPVAHVRLANDPRHHAVGGHVEATLDRATGNAYLWGGIERTRTVAYWVGAVICLMSIGSSMIWRRRSALPIALTMIGCGLLGIGLSNAY